MEFCWFPPRLSSCSFFCSVLRAALSQKIAPYEIEPTPELDKEVAAWLSGERVKDVEKLKAAGKFKKGMVTVFRKPKKAQGQESPDCKGENSPAAPAPTKSPPAASATEPKPADPPRGASAEGSVGAESSAKKRSAGGGILERARKRS